jgi:DNA polymerase III psi subunit
MSDREILFRWLAAAASRLSWKRRVRELGSFACCLVALVLLVEVVKAFDVPASVLSALAPLLVLSALAVAALFTWRLGRRTTLAQVAEAVDTRASLKDELKSAHWFAQRTVRNALVELLLSRAARTAQRLDARRLFPLGVPHSAFAALVLTVLTGALAWFSPRIALPLTQESAISAPVQAASGKAGRDAARDKELEKIAAELMSPDAMPKHDQSVAWSQLEQMAKQLPAGAEEEAIRHAVAARDGRLVAELLQLLRHKEAAAAQPDPSARAEGEEMSADMAQGILERPQEIQKKEAAALREPSTGTLAEPTARVNQRLGEQIREEQRKLSGQPAEGDVTLNPRARAVSRSGSVAQEAVRAEGQAAEADARTSVDGEAKGGNDKGKSKAGGTSGELHETTTSGEADPHPLLGDPTRLETQLQKVRVEGQDDPQQATEETLYAATRHQVSRVEYESIAAQWRAQRDAALHQSRTPLSYREAVKRYFLTEHGKEE